MSYLALNNTAGNTYVGVWFNTKHPETGYRYVYNLNSANTGWDFIGGNIYNPGDTLDVSIALDFTKKQWKLTVDNLTSPALSFVSSWLSFTQAAGTVVTTPDIAAGTINLAGDAAWFDDFSFTTQTFNTIAYSDDVVVDGNLAEWENADWYDESYAYYPKPNIDSDMTNPQIAFKWGAGGTKLYLAARVQDSFHSFTNSYIAWDGSDRIEAQIWASSQSGAINVGIEDIAQQYEFGLKSNGIDTWSGMGGGATIPASAGFQYSVKTGADGGCISSE